MLSFIQSYFKTDNAVYFTGLWGYARTTSIISSVETGIMTNPGKEMNIVPSVSLL